MTAAPSSAEAADAARRARIAAAAEGWLGTPYRHQASLRGVGADCLGLVRGVWREVVGRELERAPGYTPDWGEAAGEERLLEGARRWLREIRVGEARTGDVLLFRMRARGPAKHLGLLVGAGPEGLRMIHARSGRSVTAETVGRAWARRIAAAFSFPE